jgi:hypothetical protein
LVTEEAGKLLHLDTAHLAVYEGDGTVTTVGAWGPHGMRSAVGWRGPFEGDVVVARVFRTQRPARVDDYNRPRRARRRLRPLPGGSGGGREPGSGRGTALGGDAGQLFAAEAAARGNGVAPRRVSPNSSLPRSPMQRRARGWNKSPAERRRLAASQRLSPKPSAGRGLYRGRRRGRRAVRCSACRPFSPTRPKALRR